MAPSRAFLSFLASRRDVSDLLHVASLATDVVDSGQRMALKEVLLRATAVLLVGNLHAYLQELVEEWADLLGGDFKKLSPIGQKYVILHVQRRLSGALIDFPEESLGDPAEQRKLIKVVDECHGWLQTPTSLAASPYRSRLEGFFRQLGANAIDRALAQFREDGAKFFPWLTLRHQGYRDFFVRLNSALDVRNEIAHGTFRRA